MRRWGWIRCLSKNGGYAIAYQNTGLFEVFLNSLMDLPNPNNACIQFINFIFLNKTNQFQKLSKLFNNKTNIINVNLFAILNIFKDPLALIFIFSHLYYLQYLGKYVQLFYSTFFMLKVWLDKISIMRLNFICLICYGECLDRKFYVVCRFVRMILVILGSFCIGVEKIILFIIFLLLRYSGPFSLRLRELVGQPFSCIRCLSGGIRIRTLISSTLIFIILAQAHLYFVHQAYDAI